MATKTKAKRKAKAAQPLSICMMKWHGKPAPTVDITHGAKWRFDVSADKATRIVKDIETTRRERMNPQGTTIITVQGVWLFLSDAEQLQILAEVPKVVKEIEKAELKRAA